MAFLMVTTYNIFHTYACFFCFNFSYLGSTQPGHFPLFPEHSLLWFQFHSSPLHLRKLCSLLIPWSRLQSNGSPFVNFILFHVHPLYQFPKFHGFSLFHVLLQFYIPLPWFFTLSLYLLPCATLVLDCSFHDSPCRTHFSLFLVHHCSRFQFHNSLPHTTIHQVSISSLFLVLVLVLALDSSSRRMSTFCLFILFYACCYRDLGSDSSALHLGLCSLFRIPPLCSRLCR